MDRARYDSFVKTFFDCDRRAITGVFEELLAALEAEQALPPGSVMSQNYDTARANPEIHLLPGNLKDARDAIFPYFWGTDGWTSPLHLENVRGPANNASLIGAIACLLKNPNLCTDTYSQRSNELEVKAVTALANLVFYTTKDPWGVFTIGGTISNLYGARIGIEKVHPGAMQKGLGGERIVGLASDAAHYCNLTVAGWLGIGTENLIAVPTDRKLAMRLDALGDTLDSLYQSDAKVAFVTATFGTTDGSGLDDVAGIRTVIDEKARQYGVPTPQLHVDAAVGWALSFLTEYDLQRNPLQFNDALKPVVAQVQEQNRGLRLADSVTIDFHKLGRGHYPSSALLLNDRADLKYLARSVADTPYFSEAEHRRDPALVTLECSRPAIGPYAVMASLNGIGLTGWQMLTARALELARYLKTKLATLDFCCVLNDETTGPSVCWWVLPRGRNAKVLFAKLLEGTLTGEETQRYFDENRRLFGKRTYSLDPVRDARLSYTTDFGYRANGLKIPAWKAVFFNPKTDEAVIDRLVQSIEELV
jgi:glutamate/tyrosine decarboxylase-like PLP-dependent enzyme